MDISNYSVEDFVLDERFRKWIFQPNANSNLFWEKYLEENPSKIEDVKKARKILIHLIEDDVKPESGDFEEVWGKISASIQANLSIPEDKKIIPLNSLSTLERHDRKIKPVSKQRRKFQSWQLVAIILILSLGIPGLINFFSTNLPEVNSTVEVYDEHITVPGVKSNLTLSDGSKVVLNSGSKLRYIKGFAEDVREVFLEGEGYFEVAKNPGKPFTVIAGKTRTTALGTSFSIKGYHNEVLEISLVEGRVEVETGIQKEDNFLLEEGEAVYIDSASNQVIRRNFDPVKVLAWTNKTIYFDQTPINECIRVLENWYGVSIEKLNEPDQHLVVSGSYYDETLKNVLIGLNYSARIDFQIDKNHVKIKFNP